MKVCPSCGSELAEDLSFCPSDGSPLLSTEEDEEEGFVADETVVMSDDEAVGEKTVVMPDPEAPGEKTVVMGPGDLDEDEEEETVVPEKREEAAEDIGDATVVMPGAGETAGQADEGYATEDIPSTPDDTMFASSEVAEAPGDTADWRPETDSEDLSDEWTEEPEDLDEESFQATAASGAEWDEPESDEEPESAAAPPAAESAQEDEGKKRSVVGLIIGLVLLFAFFVVLIAAAAGVWWYMNQPSETASANAEENVTENQEAPAEDIPMDEPDANIDESVNADANTAENREPAVANTNTRATPTPRATRSPGPSPTSTVEISRPTPVRTTTPTPGRVATPTPVRSTPTPNIPSRISRGVVNGQAISLPRPAYPAAARAVNARGSVTVAVVIDRNGRVISANAVSGHPLLRAPSESAARRARFRPTLLSGQPVEVSGSIVYNFQ